MPLTFTKSRTLQLEERLAKLRDTPGLIIRAARQFGVPSALKPSARMTGTTVSGLCVPYNCLSLPMTDFSGNRYCEQYSEGCFSRSLSNPELRLLGNHDRFLVLGCQGAGTAKFWEGPDGLHAEADAPDTTWANDLLESMRRNDISGMSAGFYISADKWETKNGQKIRTITAGVLVEASVVTFPQYPQTTASVEDFGDDEDELLAASQKMELATRSAAQHPPDFIDWEHDPLALKKAEVLLLRLR